MSCLLQPLLDSTRVARLLGVEVTTLAAWRRRDYGPRWYRIGKKIRYTETDLRVWMNAQAQRGPLPCANSPDGGQGPDTEPFRHGQSQALDWGGRQ